MSYRQLQNALKFHRDNGFPVPKLNANKSALAIALRAIESNRRARIARQQYELDLYMVATA